MKRQFTDDDHYRAYIKSPRKVVLKKHGKYIHETLHPVSDFPRGTIYRTMTQDGHKIVVGYWGRKVRGQHPHFAVSSVLHPKEKNCHFQKRLAKMGVKLTPGKAISLNGVKPLTSDKRTIIISPMRFLTR